MIEATLRKVGGSVMVAIPPAFLEQMALGAKDRVGLVLEDGRLVIEPRKGPRYTLAELLAQCDGNAAVSAEERDWLDDGPVGDELI